MNCPKKIEEAIKVSFWGCCYMMKVAKGYTVICLYLLDSSNIRNDKTPYPFRLQHERLLLQRIDYLVKVNAP